MSTPPLIHVIDDDESLRTALLRLLAAAGFEARHYASTGDFLMQPPPDRPGCLLLDVRMPGPSGLDLQEALRRQGVTLPIIFLTGHATVAASVRAMKAGAVDFLTKPVDRDTLFDALRRALERDALERAARDESAGLRARFALLTPGERAGLRPHRRGQAQQTDRRRTGHRRTHRQAVACSADEQAWGRIRRRTWPARRAVPTPLRLTLQPH